MRISAHPSPALRAFLLSSLAAILALAGCGRLRSWYDEHAQSSDSHSVTVSWTASVSFVEGYNVYRSIPPGAPAKLTARPVLGTRYTDTTAEPGHAYIYYVTSVNFKGTESIPSENFKVTIPGTAAPGTHD